jgi:hypothetical protein
VAKGEGTGQNQPNRVSGAEAPGAISIADSYTAFQSTKDLILAELDNYLHAITDQQSRADRIRSAARQVSSMSSRISNWLTQEIDPVLAKAKKSAQLVRNDLVVIPAIESRLQRDLTSLSEDVL